MVGASCRFEIQLLYFRNGPHSKRTMSSKTLHSYLIHYLQISLQKPTKIGGGRKFLASNSVDDTK